MKRGSLAHEGVCIDCDRRGTDGLDRQEWAHECHLIHGSF